MSLLDTARRPLLPSNRAHLLPPAKRLLPPAGRAFLEAGGSQDAEAMLAGMSALSLRAAARARGLAARAAAAAAERRPDIERQAREFAAAAGAQTGRIAARAAVLTEEGTTRARTAMSDSGTLRAMITNHRRRIATWGAGLAIALIVIVLVGNMAATGAARRRVEMALDSYHLRSIMHYRTMSASIFGTVTLQGVSIDPDGTLLLTAEALRIDRIAADGDVVRSIRLSLDGLGIPVLQLARHGDMPPARVLVGLGYVAPKIDMTFDVGFDDSEQVGTIHTAGTVHALGSWDLSASIGGVTAHTLQDVAGVFHTMNGPQARYGDRLGFGPGRQDTAVAMQALIGAASRLTLRDASVTLGDRPLMQRMQAIPAADVPNADGEAGSAPAARDMAAELRDTMGGEDAEAAQAALQTWLTQGGRLRIRAEPTAPLPLFRADRFSDMPAPAWNDRDFLAALNLRVTA